MCKQYSESEELREQEHTPAPWKVLPREVLEDGSVYPSHILGGSHELVTCYMEAQSTAQLAHDQPDSFFALNKVTPANARHIVTCVNERDELLATRKLMRKLIEDCQNDLATWIVPDSGISDHDVLNTLLGRLDGPQSREALKVSA